MPRRFTDDDTGEEGAKIEAFLHHFQEEEDEESVAPAKISARNLDFYYGENQALFDNNLDVAEGRITAIIGPSGCGKSTHLRA